MNPFSSAALAGTLWSWPGTAGESPLPGKSSVRQRNRSRRCTITSRNMKDHCPALTNSSAGPDPSSM